MRFDPPEGTASAGSTDKQRLVSPYHIPMPGKAKPSIVGAGLAPCPGRQPPILAGTTIARVLDSPLTVCYL
jgi:hypothetical protein